MRDPELSRPISRPVRSGSVQLCWRVVSRLLPYELTTLCWYTCYIPALGVGIPQHIPGTLYATHYPELPMTPQSYRTTNDWGRHLALQ
jgi:hypothetical protein